jgi:hypothetical protein
VAARRLKFVVERLGHLVTVPEVVRERRAVELLERIGTAESRRLLKALARGDPEGELTRWARSSLARLEKRVPAQP